MKKMDIALFGAIGLMGVLFYVRRKNDIENFEASENWINKQDTSLDYQRRIEVLEAMLEEAQNPDIAQAREANARAQSIITEMYEKGQILKANYNSHTPAQRQEYNAIVLALGSIGLKL